MRVLVIVGVIVFSLSGASQASEVSAEKRGVIKELVRKTGAVQLGEMFSQMMTQQMAQALRQARPDVPPEAFQILEDEANAVVREELLEGDSFYKLMYPIYDRYFTLGELEELSAFYDTEVGKKTVRVMPQVVQESMQAGQSWGRRLAPKISERALKRLEEEGIEVPEL
ncbi:DUF2059 domain-containing protein [Algiphilus sp.]|uniref:DUF2059 domain-containing protein n=1 Tax=Algiphilus sp. TaxID=1872431 RepID=UPI0025C0C16C|nr:DUF2059 domain-containing protein [Algiphilus sp.]MCK5771482.1 DUF2059 domain-containing protein [Algiphilus sp.]